MIYRYCVNLVLCHKLSVSMIETHRNFLFLGTWLSVLIEVGQSHGSTEVDPQFPTKVRKGIKNITQANRFRFIDFRFGV